MEGVQPAHLTDEQLLATYERIAASPSQLDSARRIASTRAKLLRRKMATAATNAKETP